MNVVFDTSALLSSTLWDWSVSQKLLHEMILSDASIFSSPEIVEEYQKVLRRDFDYSEDEINKIITILLSFVKLIESKEKIQVVKNDPDDNKIIECALASNSKYIITYDNHLLKLKEFREIKIITPEEMIDILDFPQSNPLK